MSSTAKPRGRPRSFDRSHALQQALLLFRERGYEGVSLSELQKAMGDIAAPSFYAAFGSKEALFKEAVELYRSTVGAKSGARLSEPGDSRAAIEGMLVSAVESFCAPNEPHGCLLVLGALQCSPGNEGVAESLRAHRLAAKQQIARRLKQGAAAGELPKSADLGAVAQFYATFLHGLSIQARDGASRAALLAAVEVAMGAWDTLLKRS